MLWRGCRPQLSTAQRRLRELVSARAHPHYKGESTQKSSFRYVHVFYDAMLIFFRKHYGGMNALWRLPIKTAIYVKAFGSLIGTTIRATRKKLGISYFES